MIDLILLLLAVGAAPPNPTGRGQFRSPDPSISQVVTGGHWRDGKREGRYRAIVQARCSPEHCYDYLFVEWLVDVRPTDEGVGPTITVASTAAIKEVAGVNRVSAVSFVLSAQDALLEVEQISDDIDLKWHVCIGLGKPGKYTAGSKKCPRPG
jgi:hypothetical protein